MYNSSCCRQDSEEDQPRREMGKRGTHARYRYVARDWDEQCDRLVNGDSVVDLATGEGRVDML